jgi:predicted Zn-dependent protease
MKRATLLLTLPLLLAACRTVPITGRQQLSLYSDAELNQASEQQYRQMIAKFPKSRNAQWSAALQRVNSRLRDAVIKYFKEEGQPEVLNGFTWEVHLLQTNQVNAWAMPGARMAVYEGILPIMKDETGMAVIMGHEIAHAVAKHGNERLSNQMLQQLGAIALSEALAKESAAVRDMWMQAYGVTTRIGYILPYSRVNENEADYMGLLFMAMAGYDPRVAVDLWERMQAMGGNKPPEYLSTHPSDATRIENMKKHMAEAMSFYREATGMNATAQPGTQPGAQPATQPGTQPGARAGTQPGTRPGTRPPTNPVDDGIRIETPTSEDDDF